MPLLLKALRNMKVTRVQELREVYSNLQSSRIKRGLFKSSVGKLINADINGALNILRKFLNSTKETSEFSVLQKIIGSGLVFRPVRITGNGIEAKL